MKYNVSIVSYIDILGFKNIVNDNNPQTILKILQAFQRNTKPDIEIAKLYEQKYLFFSDTIIRSTNILSRINKEYQVGILFYELLDLIYIQLDLLFKGIFIRGSIVIDYLYHSNTFLFGPGLIRAYEMESTLAKYPRIIIEKETLELLKNTPLLKANHHSANEEYNYIRDLIRTYEDDLPFLDYLSVAQSEVNMFPEDYFKILLNHKDLIKQNIDKHINYVNILQKYEWLKSYHNNTVQKNISRKNIKQYELRLSDLLVD